MANRVGDRYDALMARVVDWNGKDLPDELRALPPGRYVLERVDEPTELTADEEEGIRTALRSLEAGRGRSLDEVRERLSDSLKRC